ncbi:protein NLRC5 [Diretmus argenteus]
MLEYFRTANTAVCRNFLQCMCMLCEDMPMHMESRLMSVAGNPTSEYENGFESSSSSLTDEKLPSPLSEQEGSKRPRIDHWEHYNTAVRSFLQRRWKRQTERLVREVQLEHVWVSMRNMNRARERPDQTPGPGDRGSRTPDSDGDYGAMEDRVTLESFLQGSAGQITILLGQAGSGKTLLMSCLGQLWAQGLGPIPSSFLFVLLEFRQLNLLSHPLSLSELLFQHYLPAEGGDSEKRAMLDYLLSNPEQSCWVLDGYDEFHSKITRTETRSNTDLLDPERPLPVAELISGLLSRSLLPGCTLVVTCRSRDVLDLEDMADNMGELLGWGRHEVVEYVENYFRAKGHATNKALVKQAVDLLLSSQHLLAMSSLPALCNICCACLEHLLLEQTQVYLTVLGAFLSQGSGTESDKEGGATDDRMTSRAPPQSKVCLPDLSRYRAVVWELSRLAWRGLEESKILFMEQEVSPEVLGVSTRAGLFLQVELRREGGMLGHAYCFIHLTVQEFLAALRIMTSEDVTEAQLKKRFNLKTRWTTKSDPKTVFTDSLHGFVCGLASPLCAPALLQLARGSGVVKRRQALVLKLLKNLSGSISLTGPKVLQLCHCVQETQDCQLAREVVGTRPVLELRNIQLLPSDIVALAFVVRSVGDIGVGLDFGACSMEPECLDVLPSCRYIHSLSFRGRKYNDKFAEKLSSILPEVTTLRKLEFSGASLTDVGAASLASALQNCPNITEINLSDNNLKDRGIRNIAKIFTKVPKLTSVMVGRNNSSLNGINHLIEKMSSCVNIQHVHADVHVPSGMLSLVLSVHVPSGMLSLVLSVHVPSGMLSLVLSVHVPSGMLSLVLSVHVPSGMLSLVLSVHVPSGMLSLVLSVHVPSGMLSLVLSVHVPSGMLSLVLSVHVPSGMLSLVLSVHVPSGMLSLVLSVHVPSGMLSLVLSVHVPSDMLSLVLSVHVPSGMLSLVLSVHVPSGMLSLVLSVHVPSDMLSLVLSVHVPSGMLSLVLSVHVPSGMLSLVLSVHVPSGMLSLVLSVHVPSGMLSLVFSVHVPSGMLSLVLSVHVPSGMLSLVLSVHVPSGMLSLVLSVHVPSGMLSLVLSVHVPSGMLSLVLSVHVPSGMLSLVLSVHVPSGMLMDGLVVLTALLSTCPAVVELNASCCGLLPADLGRVWGSFGPSSDLTLLDLSSNSLGNKGLRKLLDLLSHLSNIKEINASKNNINMEGVLMLASALCSPHNMTEVHVSHGGREQVILKFRPNKSDEEQQLKMFRVAHSSILPSSMTKLCMRLTKCPFHLELDLSHSSLQDTTVEKLLTVLPKMTLLQRLELTHFSLSSDNVERLVEILEQCPQISDLDLSSNLLKDEGVKHFVNFLPRLQIASSVNLSNNSLTQQGALDVASTLCTCDTASDVEVSVRDSSLEPAHLNRLAEILSDCPSLAKLELSSIGQRTEGLQVIWNSLNSLPSLHTLKFKNNWLKLQCIEDLVKLLNSGHRNCSVSLVDCAVEGRHLAAMSSIIQRCCLLTELDLSHNSLGREGAEFLCSILPSLPNLTTLSLGSKESCADMVQLSEALLHSTGIQCLNLKVATVMGPSEAKGVLDFLAAMEGLTQMEEIELDGWRMADRGVEQLTRLLPVWKGLRKISLSKNHINDQSGEKLLEALRSCNQLEELYLSGNSLGDLSAARLALVLPSLAHLTVLDVSENKLGYEGSVSLSKALVYMKNLTKIHLTSIGTSELRAVAASLANCRLIQDVSLGWNGCGDNVAVELAKVLPLCQQLVRLDLESNNMSVFGAEALVGALQSCPTLQLIRLWRNQICSSDTQRLRLQDQRLNFSST